MKTYTAYSVVHGVAATLAFLAIILPIIIFVFLTVFVVGLAASFLVERSFAAFWDTFLHGLKDYWRDVKGFIKDCGIFCFHT